MKHALPSDRRRDHGASSERSRVVHDGGPLRISTRSVPGKSILTIRGDFLSEPDQQRFREKVKKVIKTGTHNVVVDLSRVHHINSCGLGSLVSALVALKKLSGRLSLANPGQEVVKLLKITKLSRVFVTVSI